MKAKTEKTCLDTNCQEIWKELPPAFSEHSSKFIYCPFCSEELHIQCSSCKEALTNTDFRFCPWCGVEFDVEAKSN